MSREIARRPPDALPSVAEAMTVNFYQWEIRGRGWTVWDRPIGLEPPYRPFLPVSPRARAVDDGRRDDLLSSIVTGLQRLLGGRRRPSNAVADEAEILDYVDPDAVVDEDESPLWEIEVTLPAALKVSHTFASQFLVALTYCRHPLSFEVIGLESGITVQLACREEDRFPLREQLASYFPEATVREREGHLARHWNAGEEGETAIVEFGLAHEFIRPLKTYGGFDADPLIPVVGALSSLAAGEVGLIQVLFAPARLPWAESVLRSVSDASGGSAFSNAPEMPALARQKIAQPLYCAVLRVAAKSPSEERAWRIVKAMAGAMAQFTNPNVNELAPLSNETYPYEAHEEDLLARQSRRSGMLLNSEELVSLVHLPSASVRSPRLKRQSEKTKRAPSIVLGHELVLGENEHDGETQTVTLSPDQRALHMHVMGTPGTGKSTLLLNMIAQDIERGDGVAVLDPHGDLIDQILERIPESRYGDVILLDPSDEDYPIGFNILSAHSEMEKHLISSDLVAVFKRLSTSWGDQMTSVLGNAILAFLESERGGTLADLRRFLVEKEYRDEFLTTVDDHEIVYYWKKEFPLLTGRPQAPLLTRLDTFLRPKLIRHMVAQTENKLDFAEIMNGRKILLAKLSQGAIGEENAYLLGTLLVAKIHQLTLARQDMKAADRRPFYLYVDEFHNFVTPSMASILTGARKYRLGLVLAHQEIRQIKNEEVTAAVLASANARVFFRLGDQDAAKVADGFAFFDARDLLNLGKGEAICRIERADFDFNLATAPMPPVDPALAEERARLVRQLSRQRYGTPREKVVADLAREAARLGEPAEPKKPGRKAADKSAKKSATADAPAARPPEEPEASEDDAATTSEPEEATEKLAVAEAGSPGGVPEPAPPAPPSPPVAEANLPYSAATQDAGRPEGEREGEARPPEPSRPAPATVGRGGPGHKYLQQLIKLRAEGMGWRVTIEKPILSGAGSIDVALEKAGHVVACEICVTSPVEQEVGNIEKCVKAGVTRIVTVCEDRKRLTRIQSAAEKRLPLKDLERVKFLTPEELFALIEELSDGFAASVSRSRGYTVTESYTPPGKSEKKAIKRVLGDALVGSVDELRGQQEEQKSQEKGKPKAARKRKAKDEPKDESPA